MNTSSSTLWCALLPLLLLAPSPAYPQDKKGTVKVDSLAVYSRMSTESDVVKTLAQGTVVRILLSVTGDEGNWCGVASQDSSSRIGYVLCSGLDRPKDIPAVAAQGGGHIQLLIGNSYTPAPTSKRQARESEENSEQQSKQRLRHEDEDKEEALKCAVAEAPPTCKKNENKSNSNSNNSNNNNSRISIVKERANNGC